MNLIAPISYQGGKQRIAKQIIDLISIDVPFHDFCCGSGAISVELVNRGYKPEDIMMLDKSPWGLFWTLVGKGEFDLVKFKEHIDNIPDDVSLIQGHVKHLSKQIPDSDRVYIYLILQACSFGGKAIWIAKDAWQNCSFRNYWLPTATSNRRSPVNPMMPMPKTLLERVRVVCDRMYGVRGVCDDITQVTPMEGVLYIDPPYDATTAYGYSFDLLEYVGKIGIRTYVSEAKPISAKAVKINASRKKGGISGVRQNVNEEWLSIFNEN